MTSQQTYANYEAGRVPAADVLQQIAQRCGVTTDWLIAGSDESGGADNKNNTVAERTVIYTEGPAEADWMRRALHAERSLMMMRHLLSTIATRPLEDLEHMADIKPKEERRQTQRQ